MLFKTHVQEIVREMYNVKSFRFPRPACFAYKPGQFMFVSIRSGENVLKKHFTISSSPTERDFLQLTKKLTGHEFSNALDALNVGDWAEIDGPYGNFTFEGEHRKVGMLSGGIGITPLRSMCRYCTDMQLDTDIVLLYGNRSERDIVFREELEEMEERNKNLKVVLILDEPSENWRGLTGRINAAIVKKEVRGYLERVFYTCGPPGMVQAMVNLLKELGLPDERIEAERFTGY